MRKILIFLAIFALVAGMVSAQWYPRSANYTTTGDINADNGIFTGDLTVAGIGSFTGGTVNSGVYDGDFRLAANHGFYSTAGTGFFDFSNATGVFKTPTGVFTVTNGGVVPTTKTWAVTDADKLTVGSVIVPQEMVLNILITTSQADRTIFIADDAWQITKIEEVHATAQNTAFPDTGSVTVRKCTGTQAAGSGSVMHNDTMYLNSTVETVVTPTLNAATGALNLADGNRLALDFNGTMTTFANGLITVHMKRI